ncbi:MAG: dephospho-CoA kinase [Balneolaceae bacterium]|nr:MAG: dephospho-CoA kinase [Balneolaceae bacterium]
MIKIGVTGAIGSGKTTFCKMLEKLGATVFYADDEAKRLMVENVDLRKALQKAFGQETYLSDGSLNKPHLIKEAFQKGNVEKLNRIVHPVVGEEFRRFAEHSAKSGCKLIVKEAALLLNYGRPDELDLVIIIKSDQNSRVQRVVKRDEASEQAILERNARQPDFDKLTYLADYVVNNNGTVEELREKAAEIFKQIIQ